MTLKQQAQKVLAHMQHYGTIEKQYAASIFRCYDLKDVISALRKAGHPIKTERAVRGFTRWRLLTAPQRKPPVRTGKQ